jgi:DNA-binding NarL/FixJ family response regulator
MRIVLVDDHALVRAGVRDFLEAFPDHEVVGEAGTAHDALELVEAAQPDLVLMDLVLPGMDGIVATREILRRAPRARVVILSAHVQVHDVIQALDAGAAGYVYKSDDPAALIQAIDCAGRGQRYVASPLVERLRAARGDRPTADVLAALTDREREVFRMAADGRPARAIASALGRSRKTVDSHLYRIHRKLGLRNHSELVRLAMGLGLGRTLRAAPV